jgi:LPXTG-site transpeptidase (sortase) family protein
MFIDGHASGPTREGLFAYLDTLEKNDTLQVEKGDGTKLKYKVVRTEVVALSDIDMKKILLPHNGVTKGLNLMTCTGKWLPREKTYDHRVVVYTQQI